MIIYDNDENLIHKIDPIHHTTNYRKNYEAKHKTSDTHKNNFQNTNEKFADILKEELKK